MGRHDVPFGIAVPVGTVVVAVGCAAAGLFPRADGGLRLVVVSAALAWFCALVPEPSAVAATWLVAAVLVDGFVVDRQGVLAWHGMLDVERLGVLAAGAAGGLAVGRMRSWRGREQRWAALEWQLHAGEVR